MNQSGHALIEWLVAVPLVLLLAFSGLQWALIWQARHALEYGAQGAVLAAATQHGQSAALEAGFAAAMGPYWGLADEQSQRRRVEQGVASGWFAWRRAWPPAAAFTDFAEPALDDFGRQVAGESEIPNDNLRFRTRVSGATSAITLQEANRIVLQVTYGVPLVVPVVSSLMVRVMEMIDGCAPEQELQLVAVDLANPARSETPRAWACRVYRAPAVAGGPPVLRLPVRVAASAPMQSGLRKSAKISSALSQSPSLPPAGRAGPQQPLTAPERSAGLPESGSPDGSDDPFNRLPSDDNSSHSPDHNRGFDPPGFGDAEDSCDQA